MALLQAVFKVTCTAYLYTQDYLLRYIGLT